jgi:hypothetical protein
MIRRLYGSLPGPPVAKVVLMVVLLAVILVLLVLVFEWAGQFLDTGGTIG